MNKMTEKRVFKQIEKDFFSYITEKDIKTEMTKISDDSVNDIRFTRSLAAMAVKIKTNCSEEDAVEFITDGFNDNGIDAICFDDDEKIVYLVQSKYIKDGKSSISLGDTLKFIKGIDNIVNFSFDSFNKKIKQREEEIISRLSDVQYRMEAIVIMTSINGLSQESKNNLNELKEKINEYGAEMFTYTEILIDDIYKYLISRVSNKEININDLSLANWGIIEYGDKTQGYYGVVNVEVVANWWQEYGIQLLNNNIRNFKGDTEVNKGMISVLTKFPEMFVFYNNGIKIIAKKITKKLAKSANRKLGSFSLDAVSIVNGAQTYGSIGNAYLDNSEMVSKAHVFVEIITLEGMDDKFGQNITKLSNTQNKIENKDFVAMDPLQEQIKKDLMIDSIEYIYKTGSEAPILEKNCTLDDVTIAIGCYLEDVGVSADMKKAYGSTFEHIDRAPYTEIFNKDLTNYLIWNSVIIYRKFEQVLCEFQVKGRENRLLAIHGNRFLLHVIFQIYKRHNDLNQKYIDNCDIDDNLLKKYIAHTIKEIAIIKDKLYPDSYAANIFKNAKRCREIENEINYDVYDSIE